MRKKTILSIVVLAIMVAFGACSTEDILQETNTEIGSKAGRTLSLIASMPDEPATRVNLEQKSDKSIALTWETGDELQLVFVQGESVIKQTVTVKNISENGKRASFDIVLPEPSTGFDNNENFDLYGVYGGGGIDVSEGNLIAVLPSNLANATSLAGAEATSIKNRKDVMLYFVSSDIVANVENLNVAVTFKHLGSLFCVSLKNVDDTSLEDFLGVQLVGVDVSNENWAYNTDEGGHGFNLKTQEFQNKETAGNFIFFKAVQNSLLAEETIAIWGWYPLLTGKVWPELKLGLISSSSPIMSDNTLPARTESTPAGNSYYFYATWDGTSINFTNGSFSNEYALHVETMGTLSSLLSSTQKANTTKLTVTGQINEDDYNVMKNEMPNLTFIDLSYATSYDGETKNRIPDFAFGAMGDWDEIGSVSIGSFAELKPAVRKRVSSVSGANTTIKTVLLPKSITDIGNYAFAGCWGLTGELVIPEGVTTIGEYAFAECYSLELLTLPNSLITIKKGAFVFCDGFTASLVLPDGLTSIGAKAFFGCSQFTGELVIPTGVTVIEDQVFDMCFGFTSLNLHDDITKIGYASFNECSELTGGLHLSDKITEIGEAAFRMCGELSEPITLPSGLTEISDYTFAGCFNLSGDLLIPEGVTTIGEAAFNTCRSFTSLTLPESLTVIEARVFDYCDGLTGSLVIPKNVVSIGFWAFYGCEGLTGLTFAEGSVLNSISWSAFQDCTNLTGEVFFPATLALMEMMAFKGCENVEAFKFPHAEPIVYSDEMLPVAVTVKVPSGAVANYRGTDGWKEHTIVGY